MSFARYGCAWIRQRNSRERMKGYCSIGSVCEEGRDRSGSCRRSRDMAVLEVGQTVTGFSRSLLPPFVTHATSATNPSTWSFSLCTCSGPSTLFQFSTVYMSSSSASLPYAMLIHIYLTQPTFRAVYGFSILQLT